ncbi:MAG: ABC transporter permease subunit [Clostridiales bacterium]|jgi:multiple sugar transport system permease protein/putative aldouronate transport system permease protein|nr:ABC transporter permease subunit [Clostridiales bacterium]
MKQPSSLAPSASAPAHPAPLSPAERRHKLAARITRNWQLYLLLLPPVAFLAIFAYAPMGGALMAFKNFRIVDGVLGSPWAKQNGLGNFIRFLTNYNFWGVLRNTFVISIYSIAINLPCSVLLALSLNYMLNQRYRKFVQMISYFPYFISTVVMAGMLRIMFNTSSGVFGILFDRLFHMNVLASEGAFSSLYVWSGVWQGVGFSAIIYIAALTSVDPELHQAAMIDGATILQRIRHIDIPAIIPTAVILFILDIGRILGVGYEKVLAMQNPNNMGASEVISTYTYKVGLVSQIPDYSYATAIGLFQSVVGLVLLLVTNRIASKVSDNSLL